MSEGVYDNIHTVDQCIDEQADNLRSLPPPGTNLKIKYGRQIKRLLVVVVSLSGLVLVLLCVAIYALHINMKLKSDFELLNDRLHDAEETIISWKLKSIEDLNSTLLQMEERLDDFKLSMMSRQTTQLQSIRDDFTESLTRTESSIAAFHPQYGGK